MIKKFMLSIVVLAAFVFCGMARADVIVYKAYKQAFPDSHPKCSSCHVDSMPKKADGAHEWNAYGTAVKKAINDPKVGVADVPTADDISKITDVINKVGKVEDFK
jgi:hypothetical protein